jgi:SAM-dependent methyltransferase
MTREARDYAFIDHIDDDMTRKDYFERIYSDIDDPWGQLGTPHGALGPGFYSETQHYLIGRIGSIFGTEKFRFSEIGCGLGNLTYALTRNFPSFTVSGYDISYAAVKKAKLRFPQTSFYQLDILQNAVVPQCECILLSNVIWYLLHDIERLVDSLFRSFTLGDSSNYLLIQNPYFFKGQRYYNHLLREPEQCLDLLSGHFEKYGIEVSAYFSSRLVNPAWGYYYGYSELKLTQQA